MAESEHFPGGSLDEAVSWALSRRAVSMSLCIVVPSAVPFGAALRQRLRAAGFDAVSVTEPLPLRGTPVGVRLGRLLRVLQEDGSAHALAELLPYCRRGVSDAPRGPGAWEVRLSRRRAAALLFESGTDEDPAGPRRWAGRLRAREKALRALVEQSARREKEDQAARRTIAVERQHAERWLRDLKPLLPAFEALDRLLDDLRKGATLASLLASVTEFAAKWLLLPPDPPGALEAWREQVRVHTSPDFPVSGRQALETLSNGIDLPLPAGDAAARVTVTTALPRNYDGDGVFVVTPDPAPGFLSTPETPGARRAAVLLAERASSQWTRVDGDLSGATERLRLPGIEAARPLSASALGLLLGCPHRFLLQRIARLGSPSLPSSNALVEPVHQGALFHRVAERLFEAGGPALCRREGDQQEWRATARRLADEVFDDGMRTYPLWGAANRERERERLRTQAAALVEDEWQRPERAFGASEWRFGEPEAVGISVAGGMLWLRGSIDRIDILASGGLSVRDLKTGFVQGLAQQPRNAVRDLQLGVYTLVLERTGFGSTGRVEEAAYVQAAVPSASRCFTGPDLDDLREHAREWLEVARGLMAAAQFPRTPNRLDCRECPFGPVCGEGAAENSRAKLAASSSDPLRRFLDFKSSRPGAGLR